MSYPELFLSVFCPNAKKYWPENSEYGRFLRSDAFLLCLNHSVFAIDFGMTQQTFLPV